MQHFGIAAPAVKITAVRDADNQKWRYLNALLSEFFA
jgi:hypothetical protein